MKKVLICGGRKYFDQRHVNEVLDKLHAQYKFECVVHGKAQGADSLGSSWAYARGLENRGYSADWKTYSNAAGPIRNQEMLDKESPDYLVAFPGGAGTNDMIVRARRAKVEVIWNENP